MKFLLGMLVVAAFMSAVSVGRADQFNFTFTPSAAGCAIFGSTSCGTDYGSGMFTTGSLTNGATATTTGVFAGGSGVGYLVSSMTGSLDGFAITGYGLQVGFSPAGIVSFLSPYDGQSHGTGVCVKNTDCYVMAGCCTGFPQFQANGQSWIIEHDDVGPWASQLVNFNAVSNTATFEPIDMRIVHVPEPPTITMLIAGLCLLWIVRAVPKRTKRTS
jgi:hypothetical protein